MLDVAVDDATHARTDSARGSLSKVRSESQTTYGDRTFAVSGPVAWNSLPVALHCDQVTSWRRLSEDS